MAIAVVIAAALALTLVPAALAIFGRALLWPRGAGEPETGSAAAPLPATGARGRLIGGAVRFPALTPSSASGPRRRRDRPSQLALGNPVMRGLPESTSVHQGYDLAAAGLGPGVLGPRCWWSKAKGSAARPASCRPGNRASPNRAGSPASSAPDAEPLPAARPDGRRRRRRRPLRARARRRPRRRPGLGSPLELEEHLPELARAQRPRAGEASASPATRRSPPN